MNLELRLKNDVITGFSYSFLKALVEKAEKMIVEKDAYDEEGWNTNVNPLIPIIVSHIQGQLNNHSTMIDHRQKKDVEDLLELAKSFLEIFEKKR